MDIVVKGRRCEIKERFRLHVNDKLGRLERLNSRVIRIDVEVSKETNPRMADMAERVELTVHSKGPVIRAEAAAPDKYSALDLATERLETQLRKVADRKRVHRGHRTPVSVAQATAGLDAAAAGATLPQQSPVDYLEEQAARYTERTDGADLFADEGPMVVRTKTHQAKPMTLDQALYEMELVGHDFYLFVDSETKLPSVVYRRRGYDYGVIHLSLTPDD